MKVVVAQKGAREHFLAARALHQRGTLAGLVTDWYGVGGQKAETLKTETLKERSGRRNLFQHLGGSLRAARAARAEGIPDELVYAMRLGCLWWKWKVRKAAQRGQLYDGFAETDAAFARAVARMNLPEHDVCFGYSYASLEMLAAEKKRGVFTILDQIDPGPIHFRLVAEEMAQHPSLAGSASAFPTAYYERNRREWELADIIVVNSQWTHDAIVAEGADADKIEALPLAYEPPSGAEARGQKSARWSREQTRRAEEGRQKSEVRPPISELRPLKVLFLGQVSIGKGIHYLMEAARLLEREKVRFDVVGSIGILPGAVASAPQNMMFHGPVSRDRASEWYGQSDVFVLPTLSDGFAITQLEAMAYGLPVIVTPNCGRVVEEGITGCVIPPRDSQALADVIMKLVRNRNLAAEMSSHCIEVSKSYSVDAYAKRLVEIIEKHSGKR